MSLNERLISVGAAACTTDSVNPFGPNDAFSSNIALYQFDGNANDTTTNYNGTPTDITYGTGYIDQAAVFNGTSGFIELPAASPPFGDNDTIKCISAWVKLATTTSIAPVYAVSSTTNSSDYFSVQVRGDLNAAMILGRNGSSTNQFADSASITPDTNWHHYVFQLGSTEREIYIDGVKQTLSKDNRGTATNTSWASYPSYDTAVKSDIGIGRRAGIYYGNMDLDQVRMFDRALTQSEITTLYAETAATASNTNPFGEGSSVALYTLDYDASDAGGLYDGVPTNVEFGVGGQINYGARFNGSTSRITTGLTNTVFNNFTDYSISMWINPSNSSNEFFAGTVNGSALNGIYLSVLSTGEIRFFERNSTTTATSLTSTDTISLNTWSHIIAVRNGSTNYLYVNNGTPVSATNSSITHDATFQIGRAGSYNVDLFSGSIDQVRIFQSALTSTQVTQLYNETACVYTCTTDTVDYPITNVAYYKLDNSAEDETGAYDGTPTNVNYAFGRFGQAAVFNGSSSAIVVPNNILTTNDHSISMWFNLNDTNGIQTVVEFDYENRILFRAVSTDSNLAYIGNSGYFNPGITFSAGQWYHLVITFSAGNPFKIYVDGVLSYTGGNTNIFAQNNDNIIGASNSSGANGVDGKIDQVRIFSSALTSTQVESLYNEYQCEDTSTFKTVLYTGNGDTTNPTYISNVGIDLETNGGLVWVKSTTTTYNHLLMDSVRGTTSLTSNNTTAESSNFNRFQSYEANGFMILANNAADLYKINRIGEGYVAWVWKAGGLAVSNTDGTITSQVSANQDAGFSIVKWTGNDLAGQTIGHGLSSTPEIRIIKKLTGTAVAWQINLNSSITGTEGYFNFNNVALYTTFPNYYTSANSTVLSTNGTTTAERQYNNQSADYIAYCWHSVAGVSKIGTYNGSSGTVSVLGLGFKPSFVIVKNYTNTANWGMYDLARGTVSDQMNNLLYPNLANAETGGQSTYVLTANSDGFVVSAANHLQLNIAGSSYIYMAFA